MAVAQGGNRRMLVSGTIGWFSRQLSNLFRLTLILYKLPRVKRGRTLGRGSRRPIAIFRTPRINHYAASDGTESPTVYHLAYWIQRLIRRIRAATWYNQGGWWVLNIHGGPVAGGYGDVPYSVNLTQ